mgnify:CR=1
VNYINAPLADAELHISADENIIFKTVHTGDFNSTERLRIDSSGNLFLRSASANYLVMGSSGDATSGGVTNNMNWIRG